MEDYDDDKLSPTSSRSTLVAPSLPQAERLTSRRSGFARHFTVPVFSGRDKSPTPSTASAPQASRIDVSTKGPFGLTTVFHPEKVEDLLAHVVFVHGLGGGSEHTWTKDDVFWPRDLLPMQDPFQNVAIHSFGFDSDFKKSSTLNINDFSKSLLNSILNNPSIRDTKPHNIDTDKIFKSPIIIVCHSMGGLVTKRAFILSRQIPIYEEVAARIKAIVFIATPHTGSNLAGILDKLLRMSSGLKPYLEDLGRNSDVVRSINAEFPSHSVDLMLYSFYETRPLTVGGLREVMIVPKVDAILNYPHEQSSLLYGDHRSICKFSSVQDSNFVAVWQAVAACISKLQKQKTQRPPSLISQSNDDLSRYLNIWEPPVDDFYRVKSDRLSGSCQWLSDSPSYQGWLATSNSKMYWLRGPPGCGKSYAAGCAIEGLDNRHKRCCYYFFVYGDRTRSVMENFLLSMTWQMAALYPEIQRRILRICSRDPGVAKSGDYRTLLRKFWEQGILQSGIGEETYWVIDAFDECRQGQELAKFLLRAEEKSNGMIKIFITTRSAYADYHMPDSRVVAHDINTDDIQSDIARYLNAHTFEAPGASLSERETLRALILSKSNGCFLWVILVLENLRKIVGTQARLRALEELPPGMDQLYARIVRTMSDKERAISKTILTWVSLAIRPLTTAELKHVIERLAMDEVEDIEILISKYCNDLLYVDKSGRVRMRHASARGFLLRRDINSDLDDELTISREQGHKMLAMACLDYMNGPEMKVKPKRKMVAVAQERSVFALYACEAAHEHVNKSSALDTEILSALATFLKSNVLSWIEELAKTEKLDTILRFAQVLKVFLRRKSRTDLLLGEEVVIIEDWSIDLVKLVSKFGRQLLMHPESIIHIIPAFCPPNTAPHSQFSRGLGATLTVSGLSARSWDDCLCTLVLSPPHHVASGVIRRERLNSIATTDKNFCIGTSLGRIAIFNDQTSLEETVLDHQQPVLHLEYATSKSLLASASKRLIRLWNTETCEQQWEVSCKQSILAMAFVDDDQMLLVALGNNTILALNLIDRSTSSTSWIDILEEPHYTWYTGIAAEQAAFNKDLGLLALGYRHRHVLVYNYDQESYQIFDHQDGLSDGIDQHLSISIYAMAFSNLPDSPLLAVSFSCSDLVLFDVEQGTIQARVTPVWFSHLASSPDGRTLAAARKDGAIELYDFETLHKLYRIRPEDGTVAALSFSADSSRFIVIRAGGRNCRIWDPAALYRRDVGHDSVRSPSLASGSQDEVLEESDETASHISAIICDPDGQSFFVGKEDNSVSAHDTRTGLSTGVLFSHVASIKDLILGVKGQLKLLISADTAGFLMVHKLSRNTKKEWSAQQLFVHRASVTGVQQFLCNKDLTRLLIVSNDQACLHSMSDGKELVAPLKCQHHGRESYVWTQHPLDPSLVMHIAEKEFHIHEWDSLQAIASTSATAESPPIEGSLESGPHDLAVHSAVTIFSSSNTQLAVLYTTRLGQSTGRGSQGGRIICFPASTLPPKASNQTITASTESQSVCEAIDIIAGMYRERLIFLHVDGWICSVKAGAFGNAGPGSAGGKSEAVVHHFAPPLGWLRTNRELFIRVSKLGDVLFVVKGEVAVVKRGLDRAADVVR
ncbi:hypothetical protein N8I77_002403 [Diaporthe amygdali]|uniref:GPI inositol-deacylase n=1 Tax=Phomopsis amygdali TaxID=1214568 RepID=A0AAD9SUP7_PHOAM|nr:hypothetical protein N8I77_002403 [Diaporthe amygdali]